jgi:hypothetical protein
MDFGRAHILAGAARQTAVEMKFKSLCQLQAVFDKSLHQRDTATRGISLVPGFDIGGTMRQTQTAFDAVIGLLSDICDAVRFGHDTLIEDKVNRCGDSRTGRNPVTCLITSRNILLRTQLTA